MQYPTQNSFIRGREINQSIIDETGTLAMRVCSAGIMSGLTSESRPWFELGVGAQDFTPDADAKKWLEAVADTLYAIMSGSNFYASVAQQDEDLVTFGTAPMIIYEDEVDMIRCYGSVPGEYYLANSASLRPETFGRLFTMTCAQTVEMFGIENCPADIQGLWRSKGATMEQERIIAHWIEPNFEIDVKGTKIQVVDRKFPFRELYWVWGTNSDVPLSARGFDESPVCAPRWATAGNDAYGRSPCMDALPSIMQLQVEQARLMEAIEKQVRPPLIAPSSLKEQPSSTLPGHVTYSDDERGMRPMYQVEPDIRGMTENIQDTRSRVDKTLFKDLFLMIAEDNKDMTAYEVAKRNEEKLQVLGPVIQRLQNENLKPAIKRVYRIAARKGLLPPVPQSLHGAPISVEYISMLSLAQRAASTAAIERYVTTAIQMAGGGLPDALYKVNVAGAMDKYADGLAVPVECINDDKTFLALKKAAAQAQQAQQQLQAGATAAKAAGDVGVDVGGGLGAITGAAGFGGGFAPQGNA